MKYHHLAYVHKQHKAPVYYINTPGSIYFFFKFAKVKNLIQKLQENYGFNKQMNLLKKSLKTLNQSILNKNPVFSFVSLLTQLRIILSELPGLFCNTETPHTQSMWLGLHPGNRKFFWGFSLSKTFPLWTITEPVKQVYHHGHKCYLIIQTYFRKRFKVCIFNSWKNIHAFTLSFVFSLFSYLSNNVSTSTIIVKQIH